MTSRTGRFPLSLGSLGLLLAVAAYFAIGCTRSFESIEEGQMLYPSWLVAGGAVPYEDFHHLYGPALFALNGALLRWFGADLLVVRISLVVVKTLTVALTYLLTRRLASRPIALLTGAVLAAVWGTPWWVFNTPYANHYSMALTLGGLLGFLSLPRRFRLACGWAGLCFGLAATFKQTAGAFALAGFALFLLLDRDALERSDLPAGLPLPAWCVRGARLAALAAMLGFFALYLSPRNSVWNVLVLLTPAALTVGVACARELRGPVHSGMRTGLVGMLYAALGAALPVAAVALYYAGRGSLPELVFDLVRGRPQQFRWFDPFPVPTGRTLLLLLLVGVSFAVVGIVHRFGSRSGGGHSKGIRSPGRARAARIATVLGGLLLAVVLVRVALPTGLLEYVGSRVWQGPIIRLWSLVPFVAIWLAAPQALRRPAPAGEPPPAGQRALLLVYCNAVTSALLFYPSSDFLHIFMSLPAFVPLCALLLERFYRRAAPATGRTPTAGRWIAAGLIGAVSLMLVAPSIDHLAAAYAATRYDTTTMRRATAIHGWQPKFGEVAALVAYLEAEAPPGRPILVLSCEQLLYFLAGRHSAVEKDEFVFYMIAANLISDDDARRAVDQQDVIAALAAAKPLVVEGGEQRTEGRLRTVFGEVSRYLDAHYEVAAQVANYRILRWAR